jgi:hypothetical protein
VKTLAVLLLLSPLSFGQMPMTKAQKQDCSKATKAFKAQPVPNPSMEDFKALLDAMNLACGTPEDYAAKHGLSGGIRDADRLSPDCSKALEAMKISASDSTVSLSDFQALTAAAHKACGIPDEHTTPPDTGRREDDLVKEKERIDNLVGNSIALDDSPSGPSASKANAPGASDVAAPTAAQDSRIKDSQSTPDIHELLAQRGTDLNREIALGNRLIAHFQRAQTWEGIDADHPDAVALRAKIAQEEKELRVAVREGDEVDDKIDTKRVQKECTEEEINNLTRLVQEATGVMKDVKTQQDRYHALGY